jgi:UDP-N-acetylglucosamine--N-acetylmuramyl-(pentapeptide) pyrophosphoryl-undecaprenol N-acetylglucosamine transferase
MRTFRAIIAGGGTGGHVFPGIAVAREMEKRFDRTRIIFIVGHRKMEMSILDRYGYEKQSIDVEGLKGSGLLRGAGVMARLPKGFYQSARVIRQVSPEVILGVGGYTAGPVCLAGRFLGVPTAIHEQNSYPGLTNRILARAVNKVLISYEESREYFRSASIALTGNPVREELFVVRDSGSRVSSRFTILVLGGSQGAHAVNSAFVDALLSLRKRGLSPDVIHQTGNRDYERVQQEYREHALPGEVMPFIEDMTGAYARADLVVSRAGATTLAEIAALGKASLLIPYPYAANQHQDANARVLEQAGGAIVKREQDMSGEDLALELRKLMEQPERVADMGRAALARGRRDAARQIVDQLLEMVS